MARSPGGLSEAIRKALSVNGVDANGKEIKAYLIREYPDLAAKINGASFGSALSNEKKKMREGGTAPLLTAPKAAAETSPNKAAHDPASNGQAAPDFGTTIRAMANFREGIALLGKDAAKVLLDELMRH